MRDNNTVINLISHEDLNTAFEQFLENERVFINDNKQLMPRYTRDDIDYLYSKKDNLEVMPSNKNSKQVIFNAVRSIYEDCQIGRERLKYLENDEAYKTLSEFLHLKFSGAFAFGTTQDDNLKNIKITYKVIITLGFVALAAFLTLNLLWGPSLVSSSLLVMGLVVTAGPIYAILNDMIATRRSPLYYMLGHQRGQRALVESNNPNVLACSWGMMASGALSLIFAIALGITAIFVPIATFVLPSLTFSLPFLILFFELISSVSLSSPEKFATIRENIHPDLYIKRGSKFSGDFYSSIKNRKYSNNGMVNELGYVFLPLTAIGIFTASTMLTPIVLGPLFTFWLPAATLFISLVFLLCCYCFVSGNHQSNVNTSKYQLDFTAYNKLYFTRDSNQLRYYGGDGNWFQGKQDILPEEESYSPKEFTLLQMKR